MSKKFDHTATLISTSTCAWQNYFLHKIFIPVSLNVSYAYFLPYVFNMSNLLYTYIYTVYVQCT